MPSFVASMLSDAVYHTSQRAHSLLYWLPLFRGACLNFNQGISSDKLVT